MFPRLLGAVKLERNSPPNVELLAPPIWWLPKLNVEVAETVEAEPEKRSAGRMRTAQTVREILVLVGFCIGFTVSPHNVAVSLLAFAQRFAGICFILFRVICFL